MATSNPNAEKLFSEQEPAFNGGLVQNDFIKAGLFVRQNEGQKLLIGKGFRSLDGNQTTLCMVTGGLTTIIYKLIFNPDTETTQESDWEAINITSAPITPVGEWDSATGFIVPDTTPLQDDDHAVGNNGEFYLVTNAPAGRTATYGGLFRGVQVTVYDGDYILSVGEYFAVIRPVSTWDTIGVPTVINEYVDEGKVISHTHPIGEVTDLTAALAAKYSVANVASDLVSWAGNGGASLMSKDVMDAFIYRKYSSGLDKTLTTYNASEIDGLLSGIGLNSPLGTKGDIWVYGVTDARLPVGSNGQVLSSDSAQATGLSWVTPLASSQFWKTTGPTSITGDVDITGTYHSINIKTNSSPNDRAIIEMFDGGANVTKSFSLIAANSGGSSSIGITKTAAGGTISITSSEGQSILMGTSFGFKVSDTSALEGLYYGAEMTNGYSARGLRWIPDVGYNNATYQFKATGTPDGSKFLRDDNTWQTIVAGGGIGEAPTGSGVGYVRLDSDWVDADAKYWKVQGITALTGDLTIDYTSGDIFFNGLDGATRKTFRIDTGAFIVNLEDAATGEPNGYFKYLTTATSQGEWVMRLHAGVDDDENGMSAHFNSEIIRLKHKAIGGSYGEFVIDSAGAENLQLSYYDISLGFTSAVTLSDRQARLAGADGDDFSITLNSNAETIYIKSIGAGYSADYRTASASKYGEFYIPDRGYNDGRYELAGGGWSLTDTTVLNPTASGAASLNFVNGLTNAIDITGQTGTQTYDFITQNLLDTARASTGDANFLRFQNDGTNVFKVSTDGAIEAAPDTDTTTILGRTRIDSRLSNFMFISHYDQTTSNNYALRQNSTGSTAINSASGNGISFSINNGTQWTIQSGGNFVGGSANSILVDSTYSFDGDTDSMFYRKGADNVAIATGGIDAIEIDSSQNVDILNGQLQLAGGSAANPSVIFNANNTGIYGTAGTIRFSVAGVAAYTYTAQTFSPTITATKDFGSGGNLWRDLFLSSGINTGTSAGNSFSLMAYDVDGASYMEMLKVTANNTPSIEILSDLTIGSSANFKVSSSNLLIKADTTTFTDAGYSTIRFQSDTLEFHNGDNSQELKIGLAASSISIAPGTAVTNVAVNLTSRGTSALSLGAIGSASVNVAISSNKLGFYGASAVTRPSHIADATGGATVDTEARAAINSLLAQFASLGLQAAS